MRLVKSCLAVGLLVLFANAVRATDTKLNVLMIIVDDLAPVISSYGGPVATPALDELAASGVRFKNNYANAPVCGASRASLLSGLAPNATRFLSYDSRLDQEVENPLPLPAYFRQQGWHTLANGKIFDVIADSAASWSEPVWSPDNNWFGKEPDGRGEHLQAAYVQPTDGGRLPYFEKLEVADTDYPDGQVAEKSVADLRRLARQDLPFFLAVGFRKPHLPFNAPSQYWQPIDSPADPLPATWHAPGVDIPQSALHRSPELRGQYDALPLFGDPSDEEATEIVRAYHAAVRYVDAQIGSVLKGLQESGAAERTLVVVLGDHGFLLGEQRMWTKHTLLEPGLRTPLIISHPGIAGAKITSAVTDLLDLYPTLVDLADLPMPVHLEGKSLRSLLENPDQSERADKKGSVSRWMNGESVRNKTYRYTRWFDEHDQTVDEMLFDLDSDPLEQQNLANDAEFAGVVSELEGYLSSQRSGPVWSDKLEQQTGRWNLASSLAGGILLSAMAFPVPTIIALVLIVGALVALVWRRRRNRWRATL